MTPEVCDRYSRQIRFAGIGREGQEKLQKSHVAVVGCGALGSFAAGALARAGVGRLTLIDRDFVELSNLHRQWLYDEADAADGVPKSVAAKRQIARVNSACAVAAEVADLSARNAEDLLEGADLIVDGTDNFETRYLINDYTVRFGIPWVYGGAVASYGVAMPVIPGASACFACVYPEPPAGAQRTCETAGVLGPLTSLVASLQCAAAMRILVTGDAPRRITTADVWSGEVRQIAMPQRDPECRACGAHDFVWLDGQRRAPVSLCGRNAVQIHERSRPLDLLELGRSLSTVGTVRANDFALRLNIAPYELTVFPDGRAIVKGTTDIGVARSIYARYIGA